MNDDSLLAVARSDSCYDFLKFYSVVFVIFSFVLFLYQYSLTHNFSIEWFYCGVCPMCHFIHLSTFLFLLMCCKTEFPLFLSSSFLFSTFNAWFKVLSQDTKRESLLLFKFTSNYLNYRLKALGKSSVCATNSRIPS